MAGDDDSLKSYQARQGLEFVKERPRFIQDFMQRSGVPTADGSSPSRHPAAAPDRPEWEDELPVVVDSDGNVLADLPPEPRPAIENEDEQELAYLEETFKEFEHQALHPSEITQEPRGKRGRTAGPSGPATVRERPRLPQSGARNASLLSFAQDEDEDEE